jgi:hypothetical protein
MPDLTDDLQIPEHNLLVDCQELHTELLDLEAGTGWQSHRPIRQEDWDALVPPPNFRKAGIGRCVMDAHYFRRSPGAEADGPVGEREIGGRLYIHCANPPRGGPETPFGDYPRLMRVDKYHSLIFEAGRELDVIRLPGGQDIVQLIAPSPAGGGLLQSGPAGPELDLPVGWLLRTETLTSRTTIHLPNPTQAWFFANGASFQGPVETFR